MPLTLLVFVFLEEKFIDPNSSPGSEISSEK